MIISGFAGIGKSTLAQKEPEYCVDLESSDFKWVIPQEQLEMSVEERKGLPKEQNPLWPENYITVMTRLNKEGKMVFISMDLQVRQLLQERGIDFVLAYPSKDSKETFVQRMRNRGNNEGFVTLIEKNFEQWIDDLEKQPQKKIRLTDNQYLSDVFRK
jgi:adenylate kinase family enzyme